MNQPCFILPTAYFPNLEYFALLISGAEIHIEAEEYYVKQTYRNRSYILGPHQAEILTVPVLGGTRKQKIKEIEIENDKTWQRRHWRSLQSCYGKSPFWEHYSPFLEPIFKQEFKFLWQLNKQALAICLKLIGIKPDTTYAVTTTYRKEVKIPCIDWRSSFRPNINYNKREVYRPVSYVQVFGSEFVENLSILDLLFCEGPHALSILQQSLRPEVNI